MYKNYIQKLGLLFLILVIPFFILKEYKHIKSKKQIKCVTKQLEIPPALKVSDKSFVILIPAYNNSEFCEKNLGSVLSQTYPHFRIVYIDQGSSDGSLQKAKAFVREYDLKKNIQFIETKDQENPFLSYYKAIHGCSDEEIVVHLDGSDWFAHEKVLSILNRVYASDDVWLTYGQYLEYPSFRKGIGMQLTNRALTKNKLIKLPWGVSHLKTYYARLFKRIKIEECAYEGDFPTMDEATPFILPMIQKAKKHVRFIPEVLYVHNSKEAVVEKKGLKLGRFSDQFSEAMKQRVGEKKPFEKRISKADLIIFSKQHPISLGLCLQSILMHVKDIHHMIVVYEGEGLHKKLYDQMREKYKDLIFIDRENYSHIDFKSFVINVLLEKTESSFIGLTTDDVVIKNDVNLSECVEVMQKTNAYGFYLHVEKPETFPPHCRLVDGGIYAWNIGEASGFWKYPDCIQMDLYDRECLRRDLTELKFEDLKTLHGAWAKKSDIWKNRVGLFYDQTKLFTLFSEEY